VLIATAFVAALLFPAEPHVGHVSEATVIQSTQESFVVQLTSQDFPFHRKGAMVGGVNLAR
jgi:hypothetical protein